ncbi:MAG: class II fructose-bisphosphate aldolase family protein [Firmicutes bacterium]|nr:class II fructose-bisphosphate aldolase family protein [Bacillota bacterium]
MLVTARELLLEAQKDGYAVPAFNFYGYDFIRSVIEAAEIEKTPVILEITPLYLEKLNPPQITALAREWARASSVRIALHLDHSEDLRWIAWSLVNGFTSVMMDASKFPLAENIRLSKLAASFAHAAGASVEAELGHIGGVEDGVGTGGAGGLAEPAEAARLVRESGVDALAPAVGTAHGLYKGAPKIDFARLKAIREQVEAPLVLHGGSGIPDAMLKKTIKMGIAKINIGTELKIAWSKAVKDCLNQGETEPWKLSAAACAAVKELARRKIRVCV